jgi:hypothetical protein
VPELVTARLYGGPHHGWREVLRTSDPPHTVTVARCPFSVCHGREHLHGTDHWQRIPDDTLIYWLDLEEWAEVGHEWLFASYTYADPDSDLHVTVRERELLARTGAALGLDLETGQRVSGPGHIE